MVSPRLSLILDDLLPVGSGFTPDFGKVVLYRPRQEDNLSVFKGADLHIVQGFKPDYDAFVAQGYTVSIAPEGPATLAVVAVPRSKREARALIADAAARADQVIVDGQKTDGIDSLLKDIKKRADVTSVVSKAHGKAVLFSGGDFSDWTDPGVLNVIDGFETRLGVFSAERIDKASQILVDALPKKLPSRIADLGAGWGFLSHHILQHDSVKSLHMIEAEHNAYLCAKANITDERATLHWEDATKFTRPEMIDAVIMNPPFHTSRAGDPTLGQAFIAAAAEIIGGHGHVWMVANRHLPYEATLSKYFLHTEEIGGTAAFKVLHASKPLRKKR